jgi:hypothetical protein
VLIVLAGAILGTGVAIGHAESGDDTLDLLDEARQRTLDHDYSGVIRVAWVDATGGSHVDTTLVRSHNGVMEVGTKNRVLAAERERLVLDGASWTTAPALDLAGAPDATRKYRLTKSTGALIAGRATTLITATRRSDGVPVERFAIDDATGIVLQRISYDGNGAARRSLRFQQLWQDADRAGLPEAKATTTATGPKLVHHVDVPYRAPKHAGDGYALVARWKHSGKVVQLLYTDGLLSASVFEQPGRLDWQQLPGGGITTTVGGRPAFAYSLPVGDTVVWERAGVVYTAVGDAPRSDLISVGAGVASHGDDGVLTRLARVVLSPFAW